MSEPIKHGDRVMVKADAPSPHKGVAGTVLPTRPGIEGCVIVQADSFAPTQFIPFQIHPDYLEKI